MKAVNLLGTLKKEEQSNTEALSKFLGEHFNDKDIDYEIIKLVDYNILPGTYNDMGEGDEWPQILEKILAAEIIIFSTPIWWNNQSSEIQRVIERLDEIHDEIMEGKKSRLEGKTGGIVITGDSDGAQNIISNISNFYNAIGIALPPFSTLSVLWEGHKKGTIKPYDELMKKYKKDYDKTAAKMVEQLISYSSKQL
jgi:multimeric flavodoxin WrbA